MKKLFLVNKEETYTFEEFRPIKEANKILDSTMDEILLTDEEKVHMCEIVSKSGADYIKTSTGFSTSGATFEDIELFSKNVSKSVSIKAAGGISSLDDAYKFVDLGADRLGTSRIVKIVKSDNDIDPGSY